MIFLHFFRIKQSTGKESGRASDFQKSLQLGKQSGNSWQLSTILPNFASFPLIEVKIVEHLETSLNLASKGLTNTFLATF